MKKLKLIGIALAFCTGLVAADPAQFTGGYFNGRGWNGLAHDQKSFFVSGFEDGLQAIPSGQWFFGISTATYGEIVVGVDEIFQKPENAALPVAAAIKVFTAKVNGATPAEVEVTLAQYRKVYSDTPAAPVPPPTVKPVVSKKQ